MKFKAFFTQDGMNLLDKRFLPALEKMGRFCHVYLTPDHAMFLHGVFPEGGDGPQCVAQFGRDLLFRDYHISSQSDNRIAFAAEVSLLHRALHSALTIHMQSHSDPNAAIQIKLVKKLPVGAQAPSPYLSFETKGPHAAVVQDVPISKPLSHADVLQLQSVLDSAQELPQTRPGIMSRLWFRYPTCPSCRVLVDRLKNVGDVLSISITQYGDLHLKVSTSLVTVGSEFQKLRVLGTHVDPPAGYANLSASTRAQMAVQRGEALSVQVSMKHLAKSLQCNLAKPDCTFYGVAPEGACLTVIFQYFIPGTRLTDKAISFYCRLPVLDQGSG